MVFASENRFDLMTEHPEIAVSALVVGLGIGLLVGAFRGTAGSGSQMRRPAWDPPRWATTRRARQLGWAALVVPVVIGLVYSFALAVVALLLLASAAMSLAFVASVLARLDRPPEDRRE